MHTSKHTLTHIHEDEIRRGVSKEEKVDYHEWERDKKREMVKEEVHVWKRHNENHYCVEFISANKNALTINLKMTYLHNPEMLFSLVSITDVQFSHYILDPLEVL